MKSQGMMKFQFLLVLLLVLCHSAFLGATEIRLPADPVSEQTATFTAGRREVSVTFARLERPGEFSVTVKYWGPLTQEGPVNMWISLNGVTREMITLHELSDRRQTITLLSFHPIDPHAKGTALTPLPPTTIVDPDFFRQACYEAEFGQNQLEFIFFAHGRWDGDQNHNNANYSCRF